MSPVGAGALVFLTSAAVLVLEILAGRLLAPYVGVTLETYTGIIGVVLAGISLGTWAGGRMADRIDPRQTLGPMLVLGGALALLTIPLIRMLGGMGLGPGPFAIVVLSLVGFFPPAAVLSAVAPTVVKLQLHDLHETGSVVGRLSALGTAGAIVGTFITGFVLVAAFPSRPVVLAVAGALVLGGLVLTVRLRGRGSGASATAGPLALALVGASLSVAVQDPCQYESAYFCAQVIDDLPPCGGRTLYLDTLRHSCVHLDDPERLDFSYAQLMADVIASFPDGPLNALHIGGGGFTMPRYLESVRPGSRSLVLELDPTLVRIAEEELGLRRFDDLQVRVGDARVAMDEQPADAYDLVIGDAFGGLAVPWHLTTREFTAGVQRSLRPDGIYAVNVIDYPPLGFVRAEVATLQTVFDHVAVIAPSQRINRVAGGNFVLVASDAPLDVDAITAANRARGDDDEIATGARLEQFVGGAPVLTDDYAPVDQLLTPIT